MLLKFLNVYFRKIEISGNIPGNNIAVVISNHRNGMIDGFILKRIISNPLFISNKEMSPLIRYFGSGFGSQIPVYRYPNNYRQKRFNHGQLKKVIVKALQGKKIVIFPEGTSKLGPSLLPLHQGTAWILNEIASSNGIVRFMPVGLHYERGYEFRSSMEVTFGEEQQTKFPESTDIEELTDKIRSMLLEITVDFPNQHEQRRGELFADFVSHYRKDISHREICRLYAEKKIPEVIVARYLKIYEKLVNPQIPPLIFEKRAWEEIPKGLIFSVFVALAFILNLIPCAAAYLTAKHLADDNNVVTLLRFLTGVPLLLVQFTAYIILSSFLFGSTCAFLSAFGYLFLTAIGVAVYHRWRDLIRKIRNHKSPQEPKIKELLREVLAWRAR